ncbi:MAG TPA: sugar phosphate isomerase/epimerase family protein [Tepidisphaeraceae bacterium]
MPDPIDRRDVLKLGAAALAATPLVAAAAAAADNAAPPPGQKRPLKKAYFGLPKGGSLIEQMKILKEAGFDGLQLNMPAKALPVDKVQEALKESGLQLEGTCDSEHWRLHLSSPDASIRKAGLDNLMESMRQAKALGGTSVLLVPGVVNEQVAYDDAYKRSQEEIRKAVPLAQELGVRIAVENVWNNLHLSPLEAARYVDEIGSPMVGWYFDIGNVLKFGWPEQWIHILGKRIMKIHVKEYDKKLMDKQGPGAGFRVDLLEGSNNWHAIMRALDDVGYTTGDNWATIEMPGGDAARMKTLSGQLDRILAS